MFPCTHSRMFSSLIPGMLYCDRKRGRYWLCFNFSCYHCRFEGTRGFAPNNKRKHQEMRCIFRRMRYIYTFWGMRYMYAFWGIRYMYTSWIMRYIYTLRRTRFMCAFWIMRHTYTFWGLLFYMCRGTQVHIVIYCWTSMWCSSCLCLCWHSVLFGVGVDILLRTMRNIKTFGGGEGKKKLQCDRNRERPRSIMCARKRGGLQSFQREASLNI